MFNEFITKRASWPVALIVMGAVLALTLSLSVSKAGAVTIEELMAQINLLQAQLDRWINARRSKAISSIGDVKALGSEITELKHQLDRFNRGFGAGSITLEELRAYTIPLREDIASLEAKIAKAKEQENQINEAAMPSREDIKSFTEESERALPAAGLTIDRPQPRAARAPPRISCLKLDVPSEIVVS